MVASSRHRFCSVSDVLLMTVTSSTMSYWCTVTYASAYTGSARPVEAYQVVRKCGYLLQAKLCEIRAGPEGLITSSPAQL